MKIACVTAPRHAGLRLVPRILGLCALIGLSAAPLLAADTNNLRAGAAKVDITPKDLTGLVSVWAKPFDGVHDKIYARALVVGNGTETAALVATDLVEFGDSTSIRQRIAAALAIPADHIIVTASHDHNAPRSGPITPGTSSEQGRPFSTDAYSKQVDDAIFEAVKQAKASMQPARVGLGETRIDMNENRNVFNGQRFGGADPEGPSDKTAWVVKFESMAGEPIALLMNYGVHSVVAGPDNSLITGDLAGATERFVERHYDDKVVALWTMGPAGDQNPKYNMSVADEGKDKDPAKNKAEAYEAMDAEGLVIGAEMIRTAGNIKQMTPSARIEASQRSFPCATVPPRAPNPNSTAKPAPPPPATMDIRLSLIEINHIAITGVSGEIFTRIYWHLKKDSPLADTILVTMANDRIGYIGDDAEYYGPFTNPSVVRGCAENGIVDGLVDMINKAQ